MQINNDDPGSVITWDFDVMRQDVVFSVLHTKNPLPMKETVHSPTGEFLCITLLLYLISLTWDMGGQANRTGLLYRITVVTHKFYSCGK